MADWEQNNLIIELIQGREMARQLQMCLHAPSSSQETREFLIQKIIAAFEKALAMANRNGGLVGEPSQPTRGVAIRTSDSPPLSVSPRSEDSDRDFRDQGQNTSRKRKTLPRWTKQIRVSPGMRVEGPLDDGYSWRKYGQKDILGAKYPRGYYRCTHRNVQGCLATKQVQRSDEDPTIFEITYRGTHTCTQASNVVPAPPGPQENQESHLNMVPQQPNIVQETHEQLAQQELLLNLKAGLRVLTENLDAPEPSFASFHFPSASNIKAENQVFSAPMIESNISENFSYPSYMSPATSGTTYFSTVSPSGVNNLGRHSNLASSGPEINEIISAVGSSANSPTVGLEFPIDQLEFDGHNFTFDNTRFFS